MLAAQSISAAPFDAVAARYDEAFTLSRIGQAQRAAVWVELARTFSRGSRVLEIGCGTGVDACFLAERGVQVVATDSSSQMIELTTQRVSDRALRKLVRPFVLRAEDLSTLSAGELYEGAFSNFGALNCVSDLRAVARDLARVLKPGAPALLCWMGSFCLWEVLWYLGQGKTAKAFRRLHADGVSARIADGAFVQVRYPSLRTLKRAFAPEFRLQSFKGIGVAIPPSYLEPFAARFPRMLESCGRADSFLGTCPGIRGFADHVLLSLVRES